MRPRKAIMRLVSLGLRTGTMPLESILADHNYMQVCS